MEPVPRSWFFYKHEAPMEPFSGLWFSINTRLLWSLFPVYDFL